MSISNKSKSAKSFFSPSALIFFSSFILSGLFLSSVAPAPREINPSAMTFPTIPWDTAKQYVMDLRPPCGPNSNWGTYIDLSQTSLNSISAYLAQYSSKGNVRIYLGSGNNKGYLFLSPITTTGEEVRTPSMMYIERSFSGLKCPKYCDISVTALGSTPKE